MNNKKYYPFKRNNYYYGKLLTVRDFEDEQRYINDKRRINNVLTSGVGVAAGLSVIQLDDSTVSIEAGIALDCLGREITIEEAITKKLNSIDGFNELSDGGAYLCIEYREEPDEPVYSVIKGDSGNDDKSEYNKFKETYRLYMTNTPLAGKAASWRPAEKTSLLFDEGGVKISMSAPRFVNPGQTAEVKINIVKTAFSKSLEVDFIICAGHFTATDGGSFAHVYYKDEEASDYKTAALSYFLTADRVHDTETEFRAEGGFVKIGNIRRDFEAISQKTSITKENIFDILMKRGLSLNFDEALNLTEEIAIYLAKFRLLKKDGDYIIKEFEPLPFKQYIASNETLYSYIRGMSGLSRPESAPRRKPASESIIAAGVSDIVTSGGEEQIEIEMKARGKTYFSGEIAHGLGKGSVFVQAGLVDFISERAYMDKATVILGEPSVLSGTPHEMIAPLFSLAVILYPERETFQIAVKFHGNAEKDEITVKWWAFKSVNEKAEDFAEADRVNVSINEKSASIAPREKFKFSAHIEGTENKACRWSVIDKDGGDIDANGVYEAPTQEGVYEIMAQSVKYPHKRATTFVVVR